MDERLADVVAVADERDVQPRKGAELLLERLDVGQRLAGVVLMRESVDDRDGCGRGEFLDRRLGEGSPVTAERP